MPETEYFAPKELIKYKSIKKRFKTPQRLGTFVRMFSDKIRIIDFSPRMAIHKRDLFSLLKKIS